mgnify:CR=1 FL=1
MTLEMLHGKIHRATVTQADLNYVGSITVEIYWKHPEFANTKRSKL